MFGRGKVTIGWGCEGMKVRIRVVMRGHGEEDRNGKLMRVEKGDNE
jgi:hypothetical protein